MIVERYQHAASSRLSTPTSLSAAHALLPGRFGRPGWVWLAKFAGLGLWLLVLSLFPPRGEVASADPAELFVFSANPKASPLGRPAGTLSNSAMAQLWFKFVFYFSRIIINAFARRRLSPEQQNLPMADRELSLGRPGSDPRSPR